MRNLLFLLFLTTSLAPLVGFEGIWLSGGLESYSICRERDGGTHQDGRLDGVRVELEFLTDCHWYLGGEYLYARGKLNGHTGHGTTLSSDLIDEIYEIRIGYTFFNRLTQNALITPFGGWGHFEEENCFYPPSPLPCKFTDTFNYIVVGFLSGVNFTPLVTMGINFKVRFMQDGESKVTEDPLMDDVTLMMKEEIQARVEVPLTYSPCSSLMGMAFQLTPFYEFRHFGGREGYPFDFRDTKFYLYGGRFSLVYRF